MDESTSFSDVEVFWDCDSPTPSAWKLLQQGPGKNDEVHCSPKLTSIKKRPTKLNEQLYDLPRFEQSRQEIQRIITALTAVSKNRHEDAMIVKKKLLIPELSDGESTDDELNGHQVPVFSELENLENSTSLEIGKLGKWEDAQPTISTNEGIQSRQTHANAQCTPEVSFSAADAWTDDEMFTDDSLIGAVDNLQKIATPAKVQKAIKSSTPRNGASKVKHQTGRSRQKNETISKVHQQSSAANSSAKGFLNFFMEDSRPPKPSPTKDGGNLKCLKTKKISEENSSENCKRNQKMIKTKSPQSRAKSEDNFKGLDTSIPLDVLEELIMDDSWAHNEEKTNCQQRVAKDNEFCNDSKKVNRVPKRTSPQLYTTSKLPMCNASDVKVPKTDEDCFLEEDDNLLLEAVALTESQGSSVGSGSQRNVKHEFHQPIKCTAKEIEVKKQKAIAKKMQRMKQQL